MQKCRKNAKYNNAKLKIEPLGAVPLDMTPLVPRASRRGLSDAKIPKYAKMPKCQNIAKILPKYCQNTAKMPKYQNAKISQKCKNATKYKNVKMQISRK